MSEPCFPRSPSGRQFWWVGVGRITETTADCELRQAV